MEIVVMFILLLVIFSLLLRMTLNSKLIAAVWCLAAALFVLVTREAATAQSKSTVVEWLSRPELMLDTAVWITVDAAFQIGYCLLAAESACGKLKKSEQAAFWVFRLLPGVLIFPTLFALHTELVFALTGVGFSLIAWSVAGGTIIMLPLLAAALRRLIPETEIRLELLFTINLLAAALGIVATVNGRTAAVGTNRIEWAALAGVTVIIAVGPVAGALCYKYLTNKKISKIK